VRAFNRLCLQMGDEEKMIGPRALEFERRAAFALNRYSRIKAENLSWNLLGYTLPDGRIPATLTKEYMVIEGIFLEERK